MAYHTLPIKWSWETYNEFNITHSIHVVREFQYSSVQYAKLEARGHRVFVQKIAQDQVDHHLTEPILHGQQDILFLYWAYIRLSRSLDGTPNFVPAEGTEIDLTWENVRAGVQTHSEISHKLRLYGRVHPASEASLRATRTDFRVLIHQPRLAEMKKTFSEHEDVLDADLPLAYLNIKVNDAPFKRELDAMNLLSTSTYEPQNLDLIRMAIVNEPTKFAFITLDLTEGLAMTTEGKTQNQRAFARYIQPLLALHNPAQVEVLNCVKKLVNNVAIIQGPAGTGKTTTMAIIVAALVTCGHKVAVTAPHNTAVDVAAMAVYTKLPKEFKAVRLELHDQEKRDAELDDMYQFLTDIKPEGLGLEMAQAVDDVINNARIDHELARCVVEMYENLPAFEKFQRQTNSHEEAVTATTQYLSRGVTIVPVEQTLGYQIHDLMRRDKTIAEIKFQEEASKIKDYVARKLFNQHKSASDFDKSFRYREALQSFIRKDGRIDPQEQKIFLDLRAQLVARVLQDMDVIITTCNNSGSDWIVDNFRPSVLCKDDGGFANVPTACVPLTKFKGYKGVLLFGDTHHTKPTVLSRGANEMIANGDLSLMALLVKKGFPALDLKTQCRSDPEIASFPRNHFYAAGEWVDHTSVLNDNPTKQKMRAVSKKYYRVKAKQGGSVYWFVDVVFGRARPGPNGISLQNYANASAIATAVDFLLKEGIKAQQISILTVCPGNVSVIGDTILQHRIRERTVPGPTGRAWEQSFVGVTTTDSFKGKETDVVLVDLVDAHDVSTALVATPGTQGFQAVAQKVWDPRNLCNALTRAKCGQIIFGQGSMLVQSLSARSKLSNSIGLLYVDAFNRGLVHVDTTTLDTHPAVVRNMTSQTANDRAQRRERALAQRRSFMTGRLRNANNTFYSNLEEVIKIPMYLTASGATTRPAGDANLAQIADDYDRAETLRLENLSLR